MQMCPSLSFADPADGVGMNSIPFGKVDLTGVRRGPDITDLFLGEFRRSATSAFHHVATVIRKRSGSQMCRIDTGRIIATVANDLVVGKRADVDLKRDASGTMQGSVMPEDAVPVFVFRFRPFPTFRLVRFPWHVVGKGFLDRETSRSVYRIRGSRAMQSFVVHRAHVPAVFLAVAILHRTFHFNPRVVL